MNAINMAHVHRKGVTKLEVHDAWGINGGGGGLYPDDWRKWKATLLRFDIVTSLVIGLSVVSPSTPKVAGILDI